MARQIDEEQAIVGLEVLDLRGEEAAVLRGAVDQGEPGLGLAGGCDGFEVKQDLQERKPLITG